MQMVVRCVVCLCYLEVVTLGPPSFFSHVLFYLFGLKQNSGNRRCLGSGCGAACFVWCRWCWSCRLP